MTGNALPIDGLAGVVLAAGASTRLGTPKQLLRIDGETLVHAAARRALSLCADGVFVVTGDRADAVTAALAGLPVHCVLNADFADGQSTSVRAGLDAMPATTRAVLLLTCDQYLVGDTDLASLAQAWQAQPRALVAAAYAGTLGIPLIAPHNLWPRFRTVKGDRGARDLLRRIRVRVEVPMPQAAVDLDTPADLAGVPAALRGGDAGPAG